MELLPRPKAQQTDDPDEEPSSSSSSHDQKTSKLPSVDELLQKIMHVNGLVAIGLLNPSKANTILRGLQTVLAAQMKKGQAERDQSISQEMLTELIKADPKVLNMLAPLLTEEQVAWAMRAAGEASRG
jgi:hypothetical protein